MAQTVPILSVNNAQKIFTGTKALNGINLELHAGERLALLEPNGAGKTTLIQSISGRVVLNSGSIHWNQQKIKIGVVPQELAISPLLTARENLTVFGELHHVTGQTLTKKWINSLIKLKRTHTIQSWHYNQ